MYNGFKGGLGMLKDLNNMQIAKETKYEKMKLHIKYMLGISMGLIGIVIVTNGYANNEFISQISFASTITSIILSVIAIIMTIVSETKSENTKDKLLNVSDNLEGIVAKIEYTTSNLKDITTSNAEVKTQLSSINNTIENKFNIQSKEVAVEINNENNHSCFVEIYGEIEQNLQHDLFKDFTITILYISARKKIGATNISYQEYEEAIDDLDLNIQPDNKLFAWNLALIYSKAIWEDENFSNYVYGKCSSRYFYEVNRIMGYMEEKMKENI